MTAVTAKRRGRTSFADASFAGSTSLTSLPSYDQSPPTSAPLEELAHNPHNPRDGYDDEAVRELASSLAETGQLQPATVVGRDDYLAHYPDAAEVVGSARWVVLTGNRRLAAARLAGLTHLSISVANRLAGEDPRLSEATLIENLHREALPPLLEARELEALVERHGSQDAVAQRVSKTQGWVSQRIGLLHLPDDLKEALRTREITVTEARTLKSTPAKDRARRLAEMRGKVTAAPPEAPEPEGDSPQGASPAPAKPRRGRPPKSIERVAEELRRKHTSDELARLVELLSAEA